MIKYNIDSEFRINIIIVASYDEYRAFSVMHKNIDWGFTPYFFSKIFDNFYSEKSNQPYLMVLDSSLHAKMIFYPDNDDEASLKEYFDLVQNRFFR
jgi:hypothetical protein